MIFNENKILVFDTLTSTNEYASKISFKDETAEGTIIRAVNQTKGKGQKGNIWISEIEKNLTFSIILKPNKILAVKQFYMNMAISLSLVDYLKYLLPQNGIYIKWPNDIYIEKNKIAGILIENQVIADKIENSVIGIGLNVNQSVFSFDIPNPTSLNIITSINYNVSEILINYLPLIEKRIQQLYKLDFEKIKIDYLNRLLYFNDLRKYKINNKTITAKIIDINIYGKLILLTENQIIIECDLKEVGFIH